jgi:hypothetical protein
MMAFLRMREGIKVKKVLTLVLVVILIGLVGVPVAAAPPSHSLTRQSVVIASASWENYIETESGYTYEWWSVWIEPQGDQFYLMAEYSKETCDMGNPKKESDDIYTYDRDFYDTLLTKDQFNLTARTLGNDLTVNVGPVNVTWDVLAVHDFRNKNFQNFDGEKYQFFERGSIAECTVSGVIFGTALSPETVGSSGGRMVVGVYSEKLVS